MSDGNYNDIKPQIELKEDKEYETQRTERQVLATEDHLAKESQGPSDQSNVHSKNGGGIKKCFLMSMLINMSMCLGQMGYSVGVFNTLQMPFAAKFDWHEYEYVKDGNYYYLTEDSKSKFLLWSTLITTFCALGAAIGSIFSGMLTGVGKFKSIVIVNCVLIVGSALTLVPNEIVIIIGRLIYGLSVGAYTCYVPLYLSELTPKELRATMASLNQMQIIGGILLSYLFGLGIPSSPVTSDYIDDDNNVEIPPNIYQEFLEWKDSWQVQYFYLFIFGFPILVGIVSTFNMLCFFRYETPKALHAAGNKEELATLMSKIYEEWAVEDRIAELGTVGNDGENANDPSLRETICSKEHRQSTLFGMSFGFFLQFSGINAVLYYSAQIFTKNGDMDPNYATVLMGAVNFVTVIFSPVTLRLFGRRSLTIIFCFLMALTCIGLGISQVCEVSALEILFVMLFCGLFELSIGAIFWAYLAESMTPKGVGLGSLSHWTFQVVIALITPVMFNAIGGYFFIILGGFTLAFVVISFLFMKETKVAKTSG